MKFSKLSAWDAAYSVDMAIACLITYWFVVFLLPHLVGRPSTTVGVLWPVISPVFVYRDTRPQSVGGNFAADRDICQLLFVPDLSLALAGGDHRHGGVDRDRRDADDSHGP